MVSDKVLALVIGGGGTYPVTRGYADSVSASLVKAGADAVYLLAGCGSGNLAEYIQNHCERHMPDLVMILSADRMYHMDVRQMVRYHRQRSADVTIAATRVPIAHAPLFDIVVVGYNGEVWNFQASPDAPPPIPYDPEHAYACMGCGLFNTDVLLDSLGVARDMEADFSQSLLQRVVRSQQVYAYDLADSSMPVVPVSEELSSRNAGLLRISTDIAQRNDGLTQYLGWANRKWPTLPFHWKTPGSDEIRQGKELSRLDMLQLEHRLLYH